VGLRNSDYQSTDEGKKKERKYEKAMIAFY
jgi:hypothetical protein